MFSKLIITLTFLTSVAFSQNVTVTEVVKLMGSRYEITAVAEDTVKAKIGIDAAIAEIRRIENIISTHIETSETSEINRNAGIKPVKVSKELFDLIQRCIKISDLTDGAFDISWAAMEGVWVFDSKHNNIPADSVVQKAFNKVGYKNIILDKENQSVFLKEKGMRIGFGAIGQGFSANKGRDKMIEVGITSGIVNASGEVLTFGKQADGTNWKIGISNPDRKEKAYAWLEVSEMCIATSGNYEKFFDIDGRRYSHIINPKTGYPVEGVKSVTIICADAELADALATSVFVLGEKAGINLINQLKGVDCIIVNNNNEKISSKNLNLNYYQPNEIQQKHNFTTGQK